MTRCLPSRNMTRAGNFWLTISITETIRTTRVIGQEVRCEGRRIPCARGIILSMKRIGSTTDIRRNSKIKKDLWGSLSPDAGYSTPVHKLPQRSLFTFPLANYPRGRFSRRRWAVSSLKRPGNVLKKLTNRQMLRTDLLAFPAFNAFRSFSRI